LIIKMLPSAIERECAAGVVEHAWLSPIREGGRVSMSVPSGICLASVNT
jgi:hypothetical protein